MTHEANKPHENKQKLYYYHIYVELLKIEKDGRTTSFANKTNLFRLPLINCHEHYEIMWQEVEKDINQSGYNASLYRLCIKNISLVGWEPDAIPNKPSGI